MSELLFLSDRDVRSLLTLPDAILAVQEAYQLHWSKKARLFPVLREPLSQDAVFGIKSAYLPEAWLVGFKAAGSWQANKAKGEDTHQATIALFDSTTGKPLVVMGGNWVTRLRTGAAGAIATKLFSTLNAKVLAVIGAGQQARMQTEATLQVRKTVTTVRCYSKSSDSAKKFAELFRKQVEVIVCANPNDAVRDADIVITATPSQTPLVRMNEIKLGAHVNAIGSDTQGKRELDPLVMRAAQIFVDDENQSRQLGELQGLPDVPAVEIGRVLSEAHPGRASPLAITVFDSTGIALQDLVVAVRVFRLANAQGVGQRISWS